MHRVVPELIIENYRAGRFRGEFPAMGMFLDLTGFSNMTDTLMQHGQHGAEVLAGLMHGVFDPLVESIFEYGGKIVGFAGDGIMALYPIESDARSTALRALTSAYVIQQRFEEKPARQTVYGDFFISAKIGLASGSVSWGILCSPNCDQATYYFRGTAVDESAQAEHHAKAGHILLTESIFELLQDEIETIPVAPYWRFHNFRASQPDPKPVTFPPVDLNISRLFMPQEVIAEDVRGEFRQVVNLFMRFPDLSDPQLDSLIQKIFELRNKYGGLLSRMDFGDKGCNMLILWGAPVAYGNDIGRALNFLLDLKSAVDFPITAGVTYYISHAGYLGSSMYEDYTCYGWGVNLASRFMMNAPVGEIWVDDRIARRVSNWFEIEFLNSQTFKGFAAQQKVYNLYRHKPTAEPTYQGELVGRDEEFAQLAGFIGPLWENKFAGLVLVSGDAGIGKGRLVHEVRSSKQFEGKKVLWAVCQSDQIQRQSFNPLRSWMSRYFGISSTQTLEERKQSFDTKLDELLGATTDPELTHELERTRSILGALLDLYWPESLYEQLDPEGRYNNSFLALIALLKAESLRRPVILLLEDLQFIDRDTKDFLARLKRSVLAGIDAFPIAMIVTSRQQGASLEKGLIDARIILRGLSRDALGHLIETLLGGLVAPELVSLVMERSEGNPYFAEQIIRYLQEENLIETGKVGWTLVKTLNDAVLPGDVRAVLVARLDQLARGVRESVQTASVLGRQFEVPLLVHMLRDDKHVFQNVVEAEKASIWGPLDEVHYIFSHGLLRDAAYEMQMQARRRELHALAVDALEQLYGEVKNRYAELAHHAKYAELGSKAQKYYLLAGKTAAALYQNHQAIEYYKRALAFTPLQDLGTQFDILMERVELFNRIGNRAAQLKDVETLEILAAQLSDEQRLAKAKILHAHYCFTTGDYPNTIEISEHVVALSNQLDQADLALGVYIVWSQALFRSGRLDEAMKYAKDGLELARDLGQRVEEGRALSSLGLITLESKQPGLAQAYLEEALKIARETKERTLEQRAVANLANSAAFLQRDYELARSYYEQACTLAVELGDSYAQGIALGNIGWASGMLGDFSTAKKYHEQALFIAREIGNLYYETLTLMNLSGVAEAQQSPQDALRYALDAHALAKKTGDKQGQAWSYLYLGHAYSLIGQLQDAQTVFEQALNLRRELRQPALATEPMAGLIQVALRTNEISIVNRLMEELMVYLSEGGTLDGTEEPLRIYLACYAALERTNDPRAAQILETAMALLQAQVSKFNNEQSRRMYIENVPWRRAIEQSWLARKEKD
jgi:predicted ATPase/class 3 adenylate cyclase